MPVARQVFPLEPFPPSGSTDRVRGFVLLYQFEVFIEEAVAVMTNRDIVGEEDDDLRWMDTGFLFFRRRASAEPCSVLLVQR